MEMSTHRILPVIPNGLEINISSVPGRVIATHFEPSHCRRAFPCFDLPNFKATFRISLAHDPSAIALSNMEIDERPDETVSIMRNASAGGTREQCSAQERTCLMMA
jgi:hypothetical protein